MNRFYFKRIHMLGRWFTFEKYYGRHTFTIRKDWEDIIWWKSF